MSVDTKVKIQNALKDFSSGNLFDNSINLFKVLGYNTERQSKLSRNSYQGFIEDIPIAGQILNVSKAQTANWISIDLLFQLSQAEMSHQSLIFDTRKVDNTIIEAYLFFAIELKQLENAEYSRTHISDITRELNKVFSMPVMILFKHGDFLTFSVIKRRLHKRDSSKDVLEKVTSIKDINYIKPHRAHIEIFYDLSIEKLRSDFECRNFVDLHNAWQKIFDTKELNKRFYNELFNWYLWAVRSVKYPNEVENKRDDTVYNSESVIRLITRLIFVWFIKEKGLVPDILFDSRELKNQLRNFNPSAYDTSIYYRAILQNLFFATLNTQMDKDVSNSEQHRRFVNPEPKYNNPDYTDQTKYRYKDYFINSEMALKIFSSIPFLNGGLFECLDSKETDPRTGKEREFRFDGFSTYEEKQAFVPDILFFANEFKYDLNIDYGTNNKTYKVEGIINILNKYKFTITEFTPLDEEIALDPELLGKVFENLLASYNPETQSTARKHTGSFYTPREIVNYMVDESLFAYLKQKLGDSDDNEKRLRQLFIPVEEMPHLTQDEKHLLVNAISSAKILDPACGSGAFPMGILHRMVDLLKKLDPDNKLWFELQKQRAIDETAEVFNSGDTVEREMRLREINKAFDMSINYPDYARKLFLIENCIYGVDIQQIAIQISKLRFFISLIVDQKVDDNKPNRNIISMPNLETRFVAANTLIGLDKPKKGDQISILSDDVVILEKELISIRHKIFFTRKYQDKKELKRLDKVKRQELEKALEHSGYTKNTASRMAGWNPFDPMKSADFFDTETMFGLIDGFDVMIGNPPYVSIQRIGDTTALKRANFETFEKTGDLYSLFYEQGMNLLKDNGILCYITSNKWINANYGKSTRKYFATKTNPLILIDFAKVKIFEAATVFVNILITEKTINKDQLWACAIKGDQLPETELSDYINKNKFKLTNLDDGIWKVSKEGANQINSILHKVGTPLNEWSDIRIYRGITSGLNEAFHIQEEEKKYLVNKNPKNSDIIKPLLRGKDIKRWSFKYSNWYILNTHNGLKDLIKPINVVKEYPDIFEHLNKFLPAIQQRQDQGRHWTNLRDCAFLQEFDKPKIVWIEISDRANYAYDESGLFLTNSAYFMTGRHLKYILAVLNSKVADYYFFQITASIAGGRKRYTGQYVGRVPIPQIPEQEEEPFDKIVDYILLLKENESIQNARQAFNFFESVLDAMVYELYFTEAVKEAGLEVISHVSKLPIVKNHKIALEQVLEIYNEVSHKDNPIKNSSFYITAIPMIKEIEDKFSKNK